MVVKIITNIILIISLAVAQIAVISGLPGWFSGLNLALVSLIFILGFGSLDLALWWAAGTGLALELFSFLPFGAYLISFCLTVVAANFLLNYFFTNRSLYSFLALAAISTAVYEILILAAVFINDKIYDYAASGINFNDLGGQLAMNLLLTFLIFYILHFLGRNFKPVFLIRSAKSR